MLYRLSHIVPVLVALASPGVAFAGDGACPVSSANAQNKFPTPATNAHTGGHVTIFLNRHGATLSAGYDDSGNNSSSLVYSIGQRSLRAPAFGGNTATWNRVVQCVRDGLSPYDVDVVDARPKSGSYVMMMIGGRPSLLGYSRGVSGVAPYNGDVIDEAVGFVFSDGLRNRTDAVCSSTLHEIGHTLGLDHSYYCPDYMSYLNGCGEKSFTDREVSCGEYGERECASGGDTQNSHQHLANAVGLRQHDGTDRDGDDSSQPDSSPGDEDDGWDDDDGWGEDDGWDEDDSGSGSGNAGDRIAPTLKILSPDAGKTYAGDQQVSIMVWAEDTGGVADVELAWASQDSQYVFQCSAMPSDVPATCARNGSYYVFTLFVGSGERAFAVRVTDRAGNTTTSQPAWLRFKS